MLLVDDPPMYGRAEAGSNSTIATHQPALTISDTVASTRCTSRFPSAGFPATR
jgi:hypothetical protein